MPEEVKGSPEAPPRPTVTARTSGTGAFLGRAYLFFILFAAAAFCAPWLNTAWLFLAVVVLSVPATLADWHRETVRALLAVHQYQPGKGLHWLNSRLVMHRVISAILSLMVTTSAILHASFFGASAWLLMAAMPALFAAARWGLHDFLGGQFRGAAYLARARLRTAGWTVSVAFLAGWILTVRGAHDGGTEGALERVEALQLDWLESPSALARAVADAFAWGEAAEVAAATLSGPSAWSPVIVAVFAPMATIVFLMLSLQGLGLPVPEIRRLFAKGPCAADEPGPTTPSTFAIYVAVIVVVLWSLVQLLAYAEHQAEQFGSPAAIVRLPDCEGIDGKVYKLGTIDAIRQALLESDRLEDTERSKTCSGFDEAQAAASRSIDSYLDWYFSLPAEWMRIWKMLTGELEQMLADRLEQSLASEPALADALSRVGRGSQVRSEALDAVQERVRAILADNVLVLDERSCKVVRGDSFSAELDARHAQALRLRTAGSAGAGLAAGAVAAKVAAKAMTKGSMKAAAKVLAKFAAKKAAAVSVSAGTGMALGSVIPGLGTLIGGAVGSLIGMTISIAVDWAALLAEEQLTRESMKAELIEEVRNALAPARQAAGCSQ